MSINTKRSDVIDLGSPGLHTFTPTQQAVLSRDLIQLKDVVGGNAGSISVGSQRIHNILQVILAINDKLNYSPN